MSPRVPVPRLTRQVFVDLAVWMAGFGLLVGVAFPPLVVVLGVPAEHVLRPGFLLVTVAAGLCVGGVNVLLARAVVGARIRRVSASMRHVASRLDEATFRQDTAVCSMEDCTIPVDSADELGDCAAVDSLTGVRNRRFGLERLNVEWQRARCSTAPLSLLLMDIDHFKQINDVHGHLFGDQVLRAVAESARECLRGDDALLRYGGDELVAVLPGVEAAGVAAIADRIRMQLAAVSSDLHPLPTVSIGCASYPAPRIASPDDLLRDADQSMYAVERARAASQAVPLDRRGPRTRSTADARV